MSGPELPGMSREIRLLHTATTYLVAPADPHAAFDPFPLPRLPLSLAQWLMAASDHFYQERKRSVAFTILLDRVTRRWVPVPPTQACRRQSVRWQLRTSDYAEFSGQVLIAGSFQAVPVKASLEAAAAVPAFDGVHLLMQPGSNAGAAIVFIRRNGEAALADPARILMDDAQDVFLRYAERLQFPSSR